MDAVLVLAALDQREVERRDLAQADGARQVVGAVVGVAAALGAGVPGARAAVAPPRLLLLLVLLLLRAVPPLLFILLCEWWCGCRVWVVR